MMVIDNLYKIGDIVYVITDQEQIARVVTGIEIRPGSVAYLVSYISSEHRYYEFEISVEKNIMITTTN